MSRLLVWAALVSVVYAGCSDGGGEETPGLWRESLLWPRGSHPVASVIGDILFMQEESPAGLYLLRNGEATLLNADGPPFRSDYAWSPDGSHFTVSSPGINGASAGVYIASASLPEAFERVWDTGSDPVLDADNSSIFAAGPTDGSSDQGVWRIDVSTHERTRVSGAGRLPKLSGDNHRLAYLAPSTGFAGGLLVANHRVTFRTDTVAVNVLDYAWVGDSTLAFEVLEGGIQILWTIVFADDALPHRIGPGTSPAGMTNGTQFVFVGLAADRTDGLFLHDLGGSVTRISLTGSQPWPQNSDRILAKSGTQLVALSR